VVSYSKCRTFSRYLPSATCNATPLWAPQRVQAVATRMTEDGRASLAGWDRSFILQDRRRVRSTERAVVVCDTPMCRSSSEDQLWSERRPLKPDNETFIHSSFVLQHYRYVPSYQSHKRHVAKCRGNTDPSAGTCPTSDLQVPCPTPSYISPASSHQLLTIAIHPLLISSGDSQRIGGRLNANQ
jgi:hypothetical protein